jgi:hypothetical protein
MKNSLQLDDCSIEDDFLSPTGTVLSLLNSSDRIIHKQRRIYRLSTLIALGVVTIAQSALEQPIIAIMLCILGAS